MTTLERVSLGAVAIALVAIVGLAIYIERRGYCISDYTCTANIAPKAFR